MNKSLLLIFFITGISIAGGQVTNQDFNEQDDRKDWGYSITPYALLASQSTNVGGTRITQSFGELTSLTDAGFQVIAAVRFRRFGLAMDGTWASLGSEAEKGPLLLDVRVKQKILDFRASYMLYETFQMEENRVIDG